MSESRKKAVSRTIHLRRLGTAKINNHPMIRLALSFYDSMTFNFRIRRRSYAAFCGASLHERLTLPTRFKINYLKLTSKIFFPNLASVALAS